MLTDYIGRITKNNQTTTRARRILKKNTIQDESKNKIEITFWEDKANLVPDDIQPGEILAVTATSVTEFKGTTPAGVKQRTEGARRQVVRKGKTIADDDQQTNQPNDNSEITTKATRPHVSL
ncbi:hypothetical protein L1987_47047 [Smallanthus sonchifolius]|uniref:Uncharacterized protein n=1 Tax=Smallanthus sonchifolius TaxID=185202 RepID=A0ACB9G0U8_9ASTR|nr:hypothetical protein L1987_47047 [Smallanthus sonchifolius]